MMFEFISISQDTKSMADLKEDSNAHNGIRLILDLFEEVD